MTPRTTLSPTHGLATGDLERKRDAVYFDREAGWAAVVTRDGHVITWPDCYSFRNILLSAGHVLFLAHIVRKTRNAEKKARALRQRQRARRPRFGLGGLAKPHELLPFRLPLERSYSSGTEKTK